MLPYSQLSTASKPTILAAIGGAHASEVKVTTSIVAHESWRAVQALWRRPNFPKCSIDSVAWLGTAARPYIAPSMLECDKIICYDQSTVSAPPLLTAGPSFHRLSLDYIFESREGRYQNSPVLEATSRQIESL